MITKAIQESKAASSEQGTILFRAAGIGNLDRHLDVIMPGAFATAVLAAFLREGTILFNHDYKSEPVAMPTKAYEAGQFLLVEADWHSTEFAKQKRIIAEERMANSLQVGSSIGFYPEYKWFENGADLLAWASGMGYNMALFDPSIRDHEDMCWAIPKVSLLIENSLLGVLPANPAAEVESLKSFAAKEGDSERAIEKKIDFLLGKKEGDRPCQPEPEISGLSVYDARLRLAQAGQKKR